MGIQWLEPLRTRTLNMKSLVQLGLIIYASGALAYNPLIATHTLKKSAGGGPWILTMHFATTALKSALSQNLNAHRRQIHVEQKGAYQEYLTHYLISHTDLFGAQLVLLKIQMGPKETEVQFRVDGLPNKIESLSGKSVKVSVGEENPSHLNLLKIARTDGEFAKYTLYAGDHYQMQVYFGHEPSGPLANFVSYLNHVF